MSRRVTGSQVVDLFSYTCPGGRCRDQVDWVVLRPDGLHYAGPSARIVSQWILNQITWRAHVAALPSHGRVGSSAPISKGVRS